MIKKLSAYVLCAMLVLSVCVYADNVPETPPVQEEGLTQAVSEDASLKEQGENDQAPGENSQAPQFPGGNFENGAPQGGGAPFGERRMDENEAQTVQTEKSIKDIIKEYSTPITSVAVLILAYIFVIFYKRKKY